jgi:NADH-quinone oxidoreductase subunit I
MTPKWDPADMDTVEVVRGPQPCGPGGTYRGFGESLRGLKSTFRRGVVAGVDTYQ